MTRVSQSALRICPLCEATCGLVLTHDGQRITGARGDRDDVFSHGYICPQGGQFRRTRQRPRPAARPVGAPRRRTGGGVLGRGAVGGGQGLARVAADPTAGVGVYLGNPNAHTVAGALYAPQLVRALKTRNVFSASTLDQMPKQVACGYLYGNAFAFTVPDIDRTEHLVIIGANPLVSNGSVTTAADFGGKLKALKRRGDELTVIDPKRTRTAELADNTSRPGTTRRAAVRRRQRDLRRGPGRHRPGRVERPRQRARSGARRGAEFPPEAVAEHCGMRRTRSANWPARSPPPRARRCTAGSAPPRSGSAA